MVGTRSEWDPLQELMSVQKRMNDLFERALARTNFETSEGFGSWVPVGDVYESDEALVVYLELPGLEQDQIAVRVDGDELVVEGERTMEHENSGEQFHRVERSYGPFGRRFPLPSSADQDAIEATYRHGVLRVEVPRRGRRRPEAFRVAVR